MADEMVQIIGGDHDPPYPLVIVGNFGIHVDLAKVTGSQLWDTDTFYALRARM